MNTNDKISLISLFCFVIILQTFVAQVAYEYKGLMSFYIWVSGCLIADAMFLFTITRFLK